MTKSEVENQRDTEFCWLYSLANALVSSLWVRLRMFYHHVPNFMFVIIGDVTVPELKKTAAELLNRKDEKTRASI